MTATLALLFMLMTMNFETVLDTPVARVGDRIVRYREIAYDPSLFDAVAAKADNLSVDEVCRRAEELRLHQVIARELSAVATHKYHLELTAAEAAEAVPQKYRGENLVWRITETNRVLFGAVLRVRRGEDKQRVFDEELSDRALAAKGLMAQHFTPESMDAFLRALPTIADAENNLKRFTEERTRQKLAETFQDQALSRKFGRLFNERAAARGMSLDEARTEFWLEIARDAPVEILSPRYQLPSFLRGAK